MKKKKGFTLVELLVVIAIIGLLSTLAFVSLNNARSKARDAKRVSDVRQIQSALELYYNESTSPSYPAGSGSDISGSTTLVNNTTLPTAPGNPDGDCLAGTDGYYYTRSTADEYLLEYCLGGATGGIDPGTHTASQTGITGGDPIT